MIQTLKNIDWRAVGSRTAAAARISYVIAQLAAMAVVMVAEITYERRQQIRNAAVMAVASAFVTAEAVYKAGMVTRNWVERIGSASAVALKEMPEEMAPLAPLAAPVIAVTNSAASAFVNWLQLDDNNAGRIVKEVEGNFGATLVNKMDALMALPATTLREMAGTRSRYPKAKLAAMIMAA